MEGLFSLRLGTRVAVEDGLDHGSVQFPLEFPQTLSGEKARSGPTSFPPGYRPHADTHARCKSALTQAKSSLAQLLDVRRRKRIVLRAKLRTVPTHGLAPSSSCLV
jgi:hypothetical protein